MHKGHFFLGGNWIEFSLKDRYLRKGYYVGVANRSGCQSDSCCHGDACARDSLNLNLFGQPYTPFTVVLGRLRALLPA